MAKKSSASPRGGKRGCLGPDGTYDKKWCEGELSQQGYGAEVSQSVSDVNHTINERVIVNSRG
jgi:hypothetical protein